MALVTITMTIDTTSLFNLYQSNTPISQINAQLGTLITHSVTGGTLIPDPSNPRNSTLDTISVWKGDSLNLKFRPLDGNITALKRCTFINFGLKAGSTAGIVTGASQSTGSDQQQELNATASGAGSTITISYFITFTINSHQLTFDPKMQVRIPVLP